MILPIAYLCPSCFSQDQHLIDSLEQELKVVQNDTLRYQLLNKLGWEHIDNNAIKSMEYAQKALKCSENVNYTKGILNSMNLIGVNHKSTGEYVKAMKIYREGLEIANEAHFNKEVSYFLINLGEVNRIKGNYDHAITYYNDALEITEGNDDWRNSSSALNNLGLIYSSLDSGGKALNCLYKSLRLAEENRSKKGISRCCNNLGRIYSKQRDFNKAIAFYIRSLAIDTVLGNKRGAAITHYNLGKMYAALENNGSAIYYYNKSLLLAEELNNMEVMYWVHEKLSELYFDAGDYKVASIHMKVLLELNDSIFSLENANKIDELQAQYDSEKKEEQIASLEKAKIVQESLLKTRNWLIVAVLLTIVLLFTLYNRHQIRQKHLAENRRLVIENDLLELKQKTLQLQMNPHFLFNSLTSIASFIQTNDKKMSIKYLSMFSKLMRLTLENSQESLVMLSSELELLKNYISLEQLRFENKFEFLLNTAEGLDTGILLPPMLLQPHIENAILHGLAPKIGKGLLTVELCSQNDHIVCTINDDGIGREQSKESRGLQDEKHQSMAIEISQKRLAAIKLQLGLDIQFHIDDLYHDSGQPMGTQVTLKFPLSS